MIISALLNLISGLIKLVFSWINLPEFPEVFSTAVNMLISLIGSSMALIHLIIRPSTLAAAVPIVLVIVNFDKLWKLTMFVLRKIPFVGIQ